MALLKNLWLILCAVGLALAQPAAADELAEALALPVASGLTGARDAERFAWVENAAGVRNIWVADRGRRARQVTAFTEDDAQPLYHLALSRDGSSLAFVRGGDGDFPDDALPNAGSAATPPKQQIFVIRLPSSGNLPTPSIPSEVEGRKASGPARPSTSLGMVGSGDGSTDDALLVDEGHSPVFAPEGDRLAYTTQGEIWLWERGGEARRLATVKGEVSRLQGSPDGSRLLFVDNRGEHSFVALLDVAEARLTYLDPGLGHSVEPIFSPDGSEVAFINYIDPPAGAAEDSGPYWSIRVADVATGASRELWAAPPGMGGRYQGTRSRNLFWSADGHIVFPWERSGWLHPYAIDATKGGTPRDLTPGAFEVETYLLGADGRSLVYAANAGDLNRRHVWRLPLGGGAPVRLTEGDGIESYPTLGGDALAVIATDVSRPAYPALADSSLTPLGEVVALETFVAPEPLLFRAADGVEIHGQLFRGRGPGKRPAIVYVHGGPQRQMLLGFHPSGYYSNAYIMNQHLAASGYTVLAVNYRSGTGYGMAFREAPDVARAGAAEYRDILAAGRWLAARDDVDPQRIGIWGGSWGGYLTALALARDSDLFAAGVDLHGVHSMLRPVSNSLSPDAQVAARQLQWESSPLAAIDRWTSPVLLIHGDDDRNVPFSQSVVLARELAARRIPFREIVYPNERHTFLRHAHWLESLRATGAFFDDHLKGPKP